MKLYENNVLVDLYYNAFTKLTYVKGDRNVPLNLEIMYKKQPISFENEYDLINMVAERPDGTLFSTKVSDVKGNICKSLLTEEMLQLAGRLRVTYTFIKTGVVSASIVIWVDVKEASGTVLVTQDSKWQLIDDIIGGFDPEMIQQRLEAMQKQVDDMVLKGQADLTALLAKYEAQYNALADQIDGLLAKYDKQYNQIALDELTRQSNENTRKSNEATRQETYTQFNADEQTRKSNETARVSNEQGRVNAEQQRVTYLDTVKGEEAIRVSNEATRQDSESKRSTAESKRASDESTRATAELQRQSDENVRKSNEAQRTSDENIRKSNEVTRVSDENSRVNAENIRKSNETTRQAQETNRQQTYTQFNQAEEGRVEAEKTRVSEFEGIKTQFTNLAPEQATNAEVQLARTNKAGFTYASLKDRLDNEKGGGGGGLELQYETKEGDYLEFDTCAQSCISNIIVKGATSTEGISSGIDNGDGTWCYELYTVGFNACPGVERGGISDTGEFINNVNTNRTSGLCRVKPDTEYMFTKNGSTRNAYKAYYDKAGNFISKTTDTYPIFTTPSNCYYVALSFGESQETGNFMLQEGSSTVAFVPYQSTKAVITTPTALGTGDIMKYDPIKNAICITKSNGVVIQLPRTQKFTLASSVSNFKVYIKSGAVQASMSISAPKSISAGVADNAHEVNSVSNTVVDLMACKCDETIIVESNVKEKAYNNCLGGRLHKVKVKGSLYTDISKGAYEVPCNSKGIQVYSSDNAGTNIDSKPLMYLDEFVEKPVTYLDRNDVYDSETNTLTRGTYYLTADKLSELGWSKDSTTTNTVRFTTRLSNMVYGYDGNVLCSHLPKTNYAVLVDLNEQVTITNYGSDLTVDINKTKASTGAELIKWFKDNNVVISVTLQKPVTYTCQSLDITVPKGFVRIGSNCVKQIPNMEYAFNSSICNLVNDHDSNLAVMGATLQTVAKAVNKLSKDSVSSVRSVNGSAFIEDGTLSEVDGILAFGNTYENLAILDFFDFSTNDTYTDTRPNLEVGNTYTFIYESEGNYSGFRAKMFELHYADGTSEILIDKTGVDVGNRGFCIKKIEKEVTSMVYTATGTSKKNMTITILRGEKPHIIARRGSVSIENTDGLQVCAVGAQSNLIDMPKILSEAGFKNDTGSAANKLYNYSVMKYGVPTNILRATNQYTIKFTGVKEANRYDGLRIMILYLDGTSDYMNINTTYTTPANKTVYSIQFAPGVETTGSYTIYSKLDVIVSPGTELYGDVQLTYKKLNYIDSTTNKYIPLTKLMGFDSVCCDSIIQTANGCTYSKFFDTIVCKGNQTDEQWQLEREGTNTISFRMTKFYMKTNSAPDGKFGGWCNGLARRSRSEVVNDDKRGICESVNGYIMVTVDKSELSTPDRSGFLTWLASNNLTIDYAKYSAVTYNMGNIVVNLHPTGDYIVLTSNGAQPEFSATVKTGLGAILTTVGNRLDLIESVLRGMI